MSRTNRESLRQTRTIRRISFSVNGRWLASCGFDSILVIYDTRTFEAVDEIDAHQSEIKCLAWSPCETLFATCGRDKDVWIWAILTDDVYGPGSEDEASYSLQFELMDVVHGHSQDVKYVTWSHDGNLVVSCSYDNDICSGRNPIFNLKFFSN